MNDLLSDVQVVKEVEVDKIVNLLEELGVDPDCKGLKLLGEVGN
jgi:hypothetical protein